MKYQLKQYQTDIARFAMNHNVYFCLKQYIFKYDHSVTFKTNVAEDRIDDRN
jgi:hypothetical protein